ncbi:hypothetical protein AAEU33_13770 [Chryseobacterium sp. Chry.R1]|uniref:hypothetical protein n=1 Tax=Chryseobacterium sp. Chry.R1 TaxID=3139392 RepID=UPI0031F88D6D
MQRLRDHIEEIMSLTDEEFEYIKTFFTLRKVRKNQFLLHESDEVKFEFLALDGIYKVFYIVKMEKNILYSLPKRTGG